MRKKADRLHEVVGDLVRAFPGLTTSVVSTGSSHWADLTLGAQHVVIEWRPGHGFGVSSDADAEYGEGPDETHTEDVKAVVERVTTLLRDHERTRAPIGVLLRELRVGSGLTQGEVASRMGVKQAALSRIESRGDLLVSTVRRYLAALGRESALDQVFAVPRAAK